jgi:HPt (histidine-containing phosphotransfer) domain-containing protein
MREVNYLTVGAQLQQAISSVQSAAASMKAFALETQDQQAKQTFRSLAKTLDDAVRTLEQRKSQIEGQEPQYRQ